ncbi:TPA: integrase arm-type DNA-binding domain-containing protein [Serratia marcescens]
MLNDTRLRHLKPKEKLYKVNDRDGLYVAVTPAGTISFRYNYSINGRQETVTFGRKAEASLRLEGMDPSGTPLYESIKARIISGELTYEQGHSEILAYYTKADTAGPVTVGEILNEEFLKPLNMSND